MGRMPSSANSTHNARDWRDEHRLRARPAENPVSSIRSSLPLHPQEAAARILAALVESSDDAIFAKGLGGTILTRSLGAERMYGYTARVIVGRSVSVLIPYAGSTRHATCLEPT